MSPPLSAPNFPSLAEATGHEANIPIRADARPTPLGIALSGSKEGSCGKIDTFPT
jgi:hypothetical protein